MKALLNEGAHVDVTGMVSFLSSFCAVLNGCSGVIVRSSGSSGFSSIVSLSLSWTVKKATHIKIVKTLMNEGAHDDVTGIASLVFSGCAVLDLFHVSLTDLTQNGLLLCPALKSRTNKDYFLFISYGIEGMCICWS